MIYDKKYILKYLNFGGELVPVDGEPSVREEPVLLPGLDIVDDDVGQVPGLHLPDPAVVVPDLDILQTSKGSEQIQKWKKEGGRRKEEEGRRKEEGGRRVRNF